jgi:lactate dehydrogenase-like 2-hydroxyacid dehydrogenase
MAYDVYVTRKIPDAGLNLLQDACTLEINPDDRALSPTELIEKVKNRDAVLCTLLDDLTDAVFSAANGCRVFSLYAVGYDNVDVDAATRHDIKVTILPDDLTDPTANLAVALLLNTARKVVPSNAFVRSTNSGGYNPNQFLGKKITGETLGIVGAGRIGSSVVKKICGFDMRILYHDFHENRELEEQYGAKRVDFQTLLKESDYVTLHVPYVPENHHLMGSDEFRLMKPDAILINTSRGKVVHEAALVNALKTGIIGGAGLDVYENEPDLAKGLKELDNVVLTPHLGSATTDARMQMAIQAANNLLDVLSGDNPATCLNP